MRVFYFLSETQYGGVQTVLYELLRAHKRRGDDVFVMAAGTLWAKDIQAMGFTFANNTSLRQTANPFAIIRAARIYRAAVREWKPDVISCHSSFSGTIGRVFAPLHIPVVYTAHGWGFQYRRNIFARFFFGAIELLAGPFGDKVICVSESDRKVARRLLIPNRKLVVIRNGSDIDRDALLGARDPEAEKFLDALPPHSSSIVFVARFAHPKRQDVLVRAFAKLPPQQRERTIVILVGGGPEVEKVWTLAKELNVEEKVFITGAVPRLTALTICAHATLSILISDSEGLPMTPIESFRLGVPMIANDAGGIPELVDATVGALIVTSKHMENGLAARLGALLANQGALREKARAALLRGKELSAEHMAAATIATLAEVAAKKPH